MPWCSVEVISTAPKASRVTPSDRPRSASQPVSGSSSPPTTPRMRLTRPGLLVPSDLIPVNAPMAGKGLCCLLIRRELVMGETAAIGSQALVVSFEDVGRRDVGSVGGKNASLGEMISSLGSKKISVPAGFTTISSAPTGWRRRSGVVSGIWKRARRRSATQAQRFGR